MKNVFRWKSIILSSFSAEGLGARLNRFLLWFWFTCYDQIRSLKQRKILKLYFLVLFDSIILSRKSSGPLDHQLFDSLTPIPHLLAPHCSLRPRASLARSAYALHCAHSFACLVQLSKGFESHLFGFLIEFSISGSGHFGVICRSLEALEQVQVVTE